MKIQCSEAVTLHRTKSNCQPKFYALLISEIKIIIRLSSSQQNIPNYLIWSLKCHFGLMVLYLLNLCLCSSPTELFK